MIMNIFPISSPRGRPNGGIPLVYLQSGVGMKVMFDLQKRGLED
jgi:hypothetical protein